MTRDTAMQLLLELDDLEVRVAVQEGRRPDDPEVTDLKREIAVRRELVIAALAALRIADATDDATIH